ncbi:MAG: hypothetical protein IT383_22625 [Deltaproteobacteria bacterium]|nr:hypothetical protein [Deltaproteobacteria bacterium]
MIDLLLLVAATSAQQAIVMAPEVGVDALFPPTVSVLPRNGRIAVLQSGLSVVDVSTGVRVLVEQVTGSDELSSVVFLDIDLADRNTVDLLAACEGCNEERFFSWLVGGSDTAAPQYSEPDMRAYVGVDSNSPRTWGVVICLPNPIEDTPVLHVLHADGDHVRQQWSPMTCLLGRDEDEFPGVPFYVTVPFSPWGAESLCVSSDLVDAAGNLASLSDTCIPLESEEQFSSTCSTTGAPTAFTLVAFAALLAPARRCRHRARDVEGACRAQQSHGRRGPPPPLH